MRALQFSEFGPPSNLRLIELPDPKADAATAVIKVAAGSITPSDVKNVEGKMEGTTLPRVPGRDYAGTVVEGPAEWMGAEVWGTGGEIGYSINGSHAEFIAVPVASLRRKPRTLSLQQAAAAGVTYLAAWLGLIEYAQIRAGETLFVIGANGGVGGAVAQLGKWKGARVIGADVRPLDQASAGARSFDDFFVSDRPLETGVRELTKGRGADVVFDSVGGPMFEPALKSLAHRGRLAEISSVGNRRVSFDLIDFYHNESQLFGVDTRARDAVASSQLLDALTPFFERNTFGPPAVDRVFPLTDGVKAYEEVARGQVRGRLVLSP
ncbi:MAG: zinc-binding alcohol dehydrogenase family protein [Candidatus Binatus sp.]